jgi:hypothetical protein
MTQSHLADVDVALALEDVGARPAAMGGGRARVMAD